MLEEALDAAVVAAVACAVLVVPHVDPPRSARAPAKAVEFVERSGPVGVIAEVEQRITGVVGDGAPVAGVAHAMDDRSVAPRGLAEAAAMVARGERAELAVDEGNQLSGQVIGITPDRTGIDVLVAAHGREAVGEHENRRTHLALGEQARRALGHVLVERPPVQVGESRPGEADQVEQHRVAPAAPGRSAAARPVVVAGRQPDGDLAQLRVPQWVVGEHSRVEVEDHRGPGSVRRCLACHGLVCGRGRAGIVPGVGSQGNARTTRLESRLLPAPMTSTVSGATSARLEAISRGELFASFLKMGLLGFGGVLPWARRVIVDERRWLSDREFVEVIGLCQVLPGPNIVNFAVIFGARNRGPVGALLAVSALLFVPVGVMLLIAMFYEQVAGNPWVRDAIAAASAAAAGLILGTATRLLVQTRPPLRGMLTGGAAFVLVGILHLPLFWVIVVLIAVAVVAEWRASR